MLTVVGSWLEDQIGVIQVTPALYRAVKAHPSNGEPPLLGFIREIGNLFETTAVGNPLCRSYWADFSEAVRSFQSIS